MATARKPRKCTVLVRCAAVPNKVKVLSLMRGSIDAAGSSNSSKQQSLIQIPNQKSIGKITLGIVPNSLNTLIHKGIKLLSKVRFPNSRP